MKTITIIRAHWLLLTKLVLAECATLMSLILFGMGLAVIKVNGVVSGYELLYVIVISGCGLVTFSLFSEYAAEGYRIQEKGWKK